MVECLTFNAPFVMLVAGCGAAEVPGQRAERFDTTAWPVHTGCERPRCSSDEPKGEYRKLIHNP